MSARVSVLLSLALTSGAAWAQAPDPRIREGDALPSGDHLTALASVQIDESGSWLAWLDSDGADLTQDQFLLRDGQEVAREGESLSGPPGLFLDDVEFLASGAGGDLASILDVGLPFGLGLQGLDFDGRLLVLEDESVGAPEVPAGTVWHRFDGLKLNAARTLLVLGEIRNPDVAGLFEDALVRFQFDGAGALVAKNVLLTKGQFVPALGGTVNFLSNFSTGCALNGRGDFISALTVAGGPEAILLNLDTVLAREGDPAPIAGRTYRAFSLANVALNDSGEYAFAAALDGIVDSYCIIKNGQKFVQEGDVVPFLPVPLGHATLAPILLANSGDLFWYADDPNAQNDVFLRNKDVIVQRQSTVIDGHLVIRLASNDQAFDVSPDGRFWAGRVEVQSIGDVLVTADFGLVVPFSGCRTNSARLAKAGGDALAGLRLTLALDGGQTQGALPVVFFGTRAAGPGCGIPISGGELLVDPTSRFATLVGAPWTGAPVPIDVDIPADPALVDLELFAQGAFVAAAPARRLLLSNGLRLEIGAP